VVLAFGLFLCAEASAADARAYPNRPLRIIVVTAPGGAADFTARVLGQALSAQLDQTVVVENRRGTGGVVGMTVAAHAEPDGYTLVQSSLTSHGIGPRLYASKLPYDPMKDFAPVIHSTTVPLILVVHGSVPANSVKEFIAFAKNTPGLKYAGAHGSGPHLMGELFKNTFGLDLLFVPYNGSGPAVIDLAAGRVQVMFDGAPALLAQIKAGRLRPLAAASAARNPLLPELPTFAELGYNNLEAGLWFGFLVPAKTPRQIIQKLNGEFNKILARPDIRERFAANGSQVVGGTSEQFGAFMRAEQKRWGEVIERAKIKLE
jgi:tripartite-type tricarboxylate transporter receptor subunit TctC